MNRRKFIARMSVAASVLSTVSVHELLASPATQTARTYRYRDVTTFDIYRLRYIGRYAASNGFFAGIPTFEEADYGNGRVYGANLLRPGNYIEWRDVFRSDLGEPDLNDIQSVWRAVHRYATSNGFFAGIPTFEQADYGNGVVYGCMLLGGGDYIDWRDVPRGVLYGNPDFNDAGLSIMAINRYAGDNGYVAGFPTFEQADYGNGVVYGAILLKPGNYFEWRDIFARDMMTQVPSVYFTDPFTAEAILSHAGLTPIVIRNCFNPPQGQRELVTSQAIPPGWFLPAGSAVRCSTSCQY